MLDPDMATDALLLMGGEMTPQEIRTARAFIRAANAQAAKEIADLKAENARLRAALVGKDFHLS